jgi:hypothetical protein
VSPQVAPPFTLNAQSFVAVTAVMDRDVAQV